MVNKSKEGNIIPFPMDSRKSHQQVLDRLTLIGDLARNTSEIFHKIADDPLAARLPLESRRKLQQAIVQIVDVSALIARLSIREVGVVIAFKPRKK